MKTTPADHWFSRCIRERVNWVCEFCGHQYQEGDRGLHCSHYFSRGNHAVRYEPLNAFAHCFHCHLGLGSNPHHFKAWTEDKLGKNYDILVELSNDTMKGKQNKHSEKEIAAHYKSEYERMQLLRSQGVTGRIEFAGW